MVRFGLAATLLALSGAALAADDNIPVGANPITGEHWQAMCDEVSTQNGATLTVIRRPCGGDSPTSTRAKMPDISKMTREQRQELYRALQKESTASGKAEPKSEPK